MTIDNIMAITMVEVSVDDEISAIEQEYMHHQNHNTISNNNSNSQSASSSSASMHDETDTAENGKMPDNTFLNGIGGVGGGDGGTSIAGRRPPSAGRVRQRNSLCVNPLSMRDVLNDLNDLVDSDDDNDDDENKDDDEPANQPAIACPPPRELNNRQGQRRNPLTSSLDSSSKSLDSSSKSGSAEHRPLVGGFSAAAYESSRLDFYKKQGTLNLFVFSIIIQLLRS